MLTPAKGKKKVSKGFLAELLDETKKPGKQEDETGEEVENDQQGDYFLDEKAKTALLSFPYKWNQPGNVHHGIDENKINVWTHGIEPKKIEKSGTRILYLFNWTL